jgi:hypothetical protein
MRAAVQVGSSTDDATGDGSCGEIAEAATLDSPPLAYAIDGVRRVLFISLIDTCDALSAIRALEWIREDPAFEYDLSACVDCGPLNNPIGIDYLRTIVQWAHDARSDFTGRSAIVARGSRAYAGARTFAVLASFRSDRVRVLRSRTEALAWLEVVPTLALVRPEPVPHNLGQLRPATRPRVSQRQREIVSRHRLIEAECSGGRCHGERRSVSSNVGQRYLITTDDGRAGWYELSQNASGGLRLTPAESEQKDRQRRPGYPTR